MKAVRPGRQSLANLEHMASMMLHVKNGSQQKRKTPAWREQQTEKKQKEKQTTNTVKVNSYRTLLTAIETFLFPLFGFRFLVFCFFFFHFFLCVCVNLDLPKTMASVLVALRSFLADDFSRFFLEALCTLYIVNLRPQPARNPHQDNEPPSQIAFHVACSVDSTTRPTTKGKRTEISCMS